MATQVIKEKRRGRPPKNLVPTKPVKEQKSKEPIEEQLVLFLPNFDDNTQTQTNNFDSTDSEDSSIFNSDVDSHTELKPKQEAKKDITSQSSTKIVKKTGIRDKLQYLTDKNNSDDETNDDVDSVPQSKNHNHTHISVEKLIDELNRREAVIMNLKSKLKDKSLYNENTIALTKENKKKLINLGLISINKNKLQIAEKTNIACWWCTYNFDTCPCFLPDHYKNNRYYVFGNFCGFSCMLAYNENLDDYRKSIRTVLIKQMYREIFQNDNLIIKVAGPRELLTKFGGPLDISEYRDPNNICIKTFKMTIPPLIPLISEYEEVMIDK
jgi:hypothetical protein